MKQQSQDNSALPPIIELASVDSTNNYALNLLRQNVISYQNLHGTGVFAHEQWAGKGQRGKSWVTAKGENLLMSIIIDTRGINIQHQFLLSAAVALACRNFLEQYAQSDLTIKWPNDIYFKDRKLGGILIENLLEGSIWKWAVAGTGLNINQTMFDPAAKNAVSLKQITGRDFDCLRLAEELRNVIMRECVNVLMRGSEIIKEYNRFLYKRGEVVKLQKDRQVFEALVKEILPNGQLVVQTDMELRFDYGEVSWVIL